MSYPICFAKYRDPVDNKEVKEVAVVGWIRGSGAFEHRLMAIVVNKGIFYEVTAEILDFERW